MAGGAVGDGEWSGSIRMLGAASDIVWGVMDVEVKTDFPDLLSKVSFKHFSRIGTNEFNLCLVHDSLEGCWKYHGNSEREWFSPSLCSTSTDRRRQRNPLW